MYNCLNLRIQMYAKYAFVVKYYYVLLLEKVGAK